MMRWAFRPRREPRDEQGSRLILALMMVIIVAITGPAVLQQQAAAPNAQRVYSGLRTMELSLDSRMDSAIQGVRYDQWAAMPNSSNFCSNIATDPNPWGPSLQTVSVGTKSYELHC